MNCYQFLDSHLHLHSSQHKFVILSIVREVSIKTMYWRCSALQNLPIAFHDSWRKSQVRKGDLEASAERCEKADKWFVPARLTGRTKAMQQQCEGEGRLVSRRTTVFALEELIPVAEVEKGR